MTAALPEVREGETFPLALAPAGKPHRYEALDSLRGICALLVCLFHFNASGPIMPLPFIRGSWLFVDFFFVLSGFVIAANYRDRLIGGSSMRKFATLRFGRVYPLHFVMLLAFIALELLGLLLEKKGLIKRELFDEKHSIFAIFTNLTFTQAFGLHDKPTWNQPAWSIAVEFWTYLLFAFAARWAGKALERWLLVIVIGCIALLAVVTPDGIEVDYSWGLVRCIYGFAVGAIIWRLWQQSGREPAKPYPYATLAEVLAVTAVVAFVSFCSQPPFNIAAPLVFGLAVLVFARSGGSLSKLLTLDFFKTLGVLSFSIYMTHAFVQGRFVDVLRVAERILHVELTTSGVTSLGAPTDIAGTTPLQGVVLTVLMLVAVIAVSHVTWRLVEVPGQKWARRRAGAEKA